MANILCENGRPVKALINGELVDVAKVEHGHWKDVEAAPHGLHYATCSVCGERQTIEVANFCPMCGASMDGEDLPKRFWPEQVEKLMMEALAKKNEDDNYCTEENCETFQRDLNCERCNK